MFKINTTLINGSFLFLFWGFCLHDKNLLDVMRARYYYEIINNENNIYKNRVKRLIKEFHDKQQAELNPKSAQPQVQTS